MKNHYDIFLTKIFLTIASITGVSTNILQDVDLLFGIILKFISIISFLIVITINLPKLFRIIKIWLEK